MLGIDRPATHAELTATLPMLVKLTPRLRMELDTRAAALTGQEDQRAFERRDCEGVAVATLRSSPAALAAKQEPALVIVREISQSGCGILAHQQWFPNQTLTLTFPDAEVAARVMRCRYLAHECFAVGLRITGYRRLDR
jgi:hypothetical protein